VMMMWVNNIYYVYVRRILFSDTHSGVCSYEHLPRNNFHRMNVLVPTSKSVMTHIFYITANFNSKSYLQKNTITIP
jgi:hypothetical protein